MEEEAEIGIWILAFVCGLSGFVCGYIVAALPKWAAKLLKMFKVNL